ncbi:GatB/YqeY domain-containing protein [Vibrio sp. D431a]|uniref:GatB/YqeY domain-containing protein n=1 Tax=Vibrio sp. D431a TaxID=2837388 RepID=UPI0025574700|nr:GatB/YqeY domain-containing protein [Vibrio sp. D431a]MDK9793297.1 GatB/YqeY domain-containing protein [Vibrio sp. D431a]
MLSIETLKKEKLLALKQGKKPKSKLIGLLLASLQAVEKTGGSVSEDLVVSEIHGLTKQINFNIKICKENDREKDLQMYEQEIAYMNELLSLASIQMLSDADLDAIIAKLEAQSKSDLGRVMGYLKSNHFGQYNPSEASLYIRTKL